MLTNWWVVTGIIYPSRRLDIPHMEPPDSHSFPHSLRHLRYHSALFKFHVSLASVRSCTMVNAASPSGSSVAGSGNKNAKAGDKRKADDGDDGSPQGQTHTRSKRSRYISIACNECKRRKV